MIQLGLSVTHGFSQAVRQDPQPLLPVLGEARRCMAQTQEGLGGKVMENEAPTIWLFKIAMENQSEKWRF